jgi:hypothetical protein
MIHEKQVRQFCAIHTVNNLLQLSSSDDANGVVTESKGISASDDEGSSKQTYITTEWRCHGRLIYRQRQLRRSDSSSDDQCNASRISYKKNFNIVATQTEFNEIAEDFTNRELRLMEGSDPMIQDPNEGATEVSGRKLSTMQRLRSNYGTPVFGNYSVEVLETALNRRGVKIEYYRIQENAQTVNNVDEEVIGFIVHEEETKNSLSYLRRLGSYIPLVSHMCKGGRHWWAITGVKRSCHISDESDNENDTNHVEKQVKEEKEWFLIDSNLDHIPKISSDDDLIHYLSNVQGRGALIFRCFVSKIMT